tara:strand:+ start:1228 stop:1983 length:756 start_codon:yes stop_codon:yes gene_type:complete
MLGHPILKFPPLYEGILVKRYKRFLADVKLENGEVVVAHCANTGPMKGLLSPSARVRIRYNPSPTRKLKWTWEQVKLVGEKGSSCWVGINTLIANKLVLLAIEAGYLNNQLGPISRVRKEVTYGIEQKSRIDLLLYPGEKNTDIRNIYVEVKNTTWTEGPLALFPDTITKRGQKHLKELISVIPESKSVLIPCISRNDVKTFAPGDEADKEYGDLFRLALRAGVEVIPCCFGFHKDCITWEGFAEVKERLK